MIDRLKDDHENAQFIAKKLRITDGIKVDIENVQTNIVTFQFDAQVTDELFLKKLQEKGVLALSQSKTKFV